MIAPPGVTMPSHLLLVDNFASKMHSSSTNEKTENESTTLQGEYDIYSGLVPVTLIADCIIYQQQKGIRDADNAQAAR